MSDLKPPVKNGTAFCMSYVTLVVGNIGTGAPIFPIPKELEFVDSQDKKASVTKAVPFIFTPVALMFNDIVGLLRTISVGLTVIELTPPASMVIVPPSNLIESVGFERSTFVASWVILVEPLDADDVTVPSSNVKESAVLSSTIFPPVACATVFSKRIEVVLVVAKVFDRRMEVPFALEFSQIKPCSVVAVVFLTVVP
jgi:hypothetical protein